jgi:hypothetical protein
LARTYLQLVNDVLVRLREAPVATVSQTSYSNLVGALINDAKREVEDAWQWSSLLDYLQFSTVAGQSTYDTNLMSTRYSSTPVSGSTASDRSRLWLDDRESTPILLNVSLNHEARLTYEPVLNNQVIKQQILNQPTQGRTPPSSWQIIQSDQYFQAGNWNKQVLLYGLPDAVYTMRLFIVNPQNELTADADTMKVPSAPVVQKAYLYTLYERGEELGETLTLTAQKVADTTADAISHDQQFSQQSLQLVIPYGAGY